MQPKTKFPNRSQKTQKHRASQPLSFIDLPYLKRERESYLKFKFLKLVKIGSFLVVGGWSVGRSQREGQRRTDDR